ncbi:MAG: cytidine deaminase [Muribaculaceae bacterium]|nr:cytidine deaminase [Muribaculaceae bacterium]
MTEKNLTTKIQVLAHIELNETEKNLVALAKEATQGSYAPYSHFHVGAAILLENGVMIKGANQENAAFSGICGERSAFYNAGANYPGVDVTMVAIAARSQDGFVDEPCSPCGLCRQAMLEFEINAKQPITVLLVGEKCIYRLPSVASLLPLCFTEF